MVVKIIWIVSNSQSVRRIDPLDPLPTMVFNRTSQSILTRCPCTPFFMSCCFGVIQDIINAHEPSCNPVEGWCNDTRCLGGGSVRGLACPGEQVP